MSAHTVSRMIVSGALTLLLGQPAPDEIRDMQWHLDYLSIDRAHSSTKGDGVVVGVVDTGVDAKHPDLADSVLPGIDLAAVPTPDGWQDIDGHGTRVAGLIAANGRALGIAPEAKVLPVRMHELRDTLGDSAAGIDWAVDHGATVLCLAFVSDDEQTLRQSVSRAIAHDVVVVAGIGNTDIVSGGFPARYQGVVAAAGSDRNGDHAPGSVTGSHAALTAPSVDIVSTASRNVSQSGYQRSSGTSDATAIVAGLAALVRAKFPELSAVEVIHRMTATADDKGPPGRDPQFGFGIVNPVKALTADVPPLEPSVAPTTAEPSEGARDGRPGSSRLLLVAGGVALATLLIGGLILALRRRQS